MKCMVEWRTPEAVHYTAPHVIFHKVLTHSVTLSENIFYCITQIIWLIGALCITVLHSSSPAVRNK